METIEERYLDCVTRLEAAEADSAIYQDDIRELVGALSLLVNDVKDYEAWQRPCYALEEAQRILAKHQGNFACGSNQRST